jgi:hypothetical protein
MNEQQRVIGDAPVRRFEYDDVVVFAADVGVADAVDVVDETVIVVAGDQQYDFELPEGEDAQAFIKNGVLTVEVRE